MELTDLATTSSHSYNQIQKVKKYYSLILYNLTSYYKKFTGEYNSLYLLKALIRGLFFMKEVAFIV